MFKQCNEIRLNQTTDKSPPAVACNGSGEMEAILILDGITFISFKDLSQNRDAPFSLMNGIN